MNITKLQFKNFKRFSDITIDNVPETSKLVLLIGANGSGKSSLFDGFNYLQSQTAQGSQNEEVIDYYQKGNSLGEISIETPSGKIHSLLGVQNTGDNLNTLKLFGRSSLRIVPTLGKKGNPYEIEEDTDRPKKFIDNDVRFVNDVYSYIKQIDDALREPVFSGKEANTLQIFHSFIDPLNKSLTRIFKNDKLVIQIVEFASSTPEVPAKLIFKKGNSKINYDLLSHGEKQVVVLLLNFIVRKSHYQDSIIYIDEMDCHLNTSLQYNLLEEIVINWIPDSSQLWTASHALGFIDFARKSAQASIIDFDSLDFDYPQILLPEPKENLEVYEIAIPRNFMFELLSNKKLVVCENQNDKYFNLLNLQDTIFVGVRDSRDVFLHIKREKRYLSIRDRDFLSDSEIIRISEKYPNHRILHYYDFENYIYHPDNLLEINPLGFNKSEYLTEILRQKNDRIYSILPVLGTSRQNYEEFKTDDTLRDKTLDSIIEDLRSDDFERFYKFFDMKSQFNRKYLEKFGLSKEKLVSTKWFKAQIITLLGEYNK
jgi:AAA15 family ATPase/GTPase